MKTNHSGQADDRPLVDEGIRDICAEPIPEGPSRTALDAIVTAMHATPPSVAMPVVARRSRVLTVSRLAASAAILLAICLGVFWIALDGSRGIVLADVLEKARNAKSVTWTTMIYTTKYDRDKTHVWQCSSVHENAFKAPGRYRTVDYDYNGQPWQIVTKDNVRGIELRLQLKSKLATLRDYGAMPEIVLKKGQADRCGRLELLQDHLQWDPHPKPLGTREMDGRQAVGFRANWWRDEKADIWIDAKTQTIVRYYHPSTDVYDPENGPAAKNKPLDDYYGQQIMGSVQKDIVWDVPLDDALFSVTPPPGYKVTVIKRREVTEKDFLRWLGILARYNKGMFPNTPDLPGNPDELDALEKKPATQRTPEETAILTSIGCLPGRSETEHPRPSWRFVLFTAGDTWHYQGQGVKLGDADAPVCWYRPKDAKDYRVIYGDLTVRDVPPERLPEKRR